MSANKKIAIIGTVGLPAAYGGFETLTHHLVKQLGEQYDITVYCSKKHYAKAARSATYGNARLKYMPFNANGIQGLIYDGLSICNALFFADVLLVLGLTGAWMLPFVKLFTNKKVIVSIDGIEWKKDKHNRLVKWYFKWAEKIAIKYSNADISDNESVLDYTALRYGTVSNLIEYGANHTIAVKPTAADKEMYPFLAKPFAFKVCNILPANNIHIVLEAFSKMNKYKLVMIGNWKSSSYGNKLLKQYGNYSNLVLLDPIYDQHALDLIRGNAYVYIHGHSTGGTNPSLVEAMYLGLPVIAFDVSFNRATTENKAFYFTTANDLVTIIENTRIAELKEQSLVMKDIADRRYTWEIIAEKYDYLFYRVLRSRKKISVRPAAASQKTQSEFGHHNMQTTSLFYERDKIKM